MADLLKPDYLITPHHFEDLKTKESAALLTGVIADLYEQINTEREPAAEVTPRIYIPWEPVLRTDCDDGNNVYFWTRATGNTIWGNPQKAADTQPIILEFHQDAVGSRTLTLGDKFRLGDDITSATPSTAALSITMYGAIYNEAYGIFLVVSKVRGYRP